MPLPTLPKAVKASTLRRAVVYNTERPHQALGMRPPIDRFVLAVKAGADLEVVDPIPVAIPGHVNRNGIGQRNKDLAVTLG